MQQFTLVHPNCVTRSTGHSGASLVAEFYQIPQKSNEGGGTHTTAYIRHGCICGIPSGVSVAPEVLFSAL